MGIVDAFDALGRGDQYQRANLAGAGLFQHVDGGDHGAAGGQHRVYDQGHALVQFADQLFQIGVCFQRFLVACQTDDTDLGARHQAEDAIEHAQTGTQDGHHGNFLAAELLDLHIAAPAFDGMGLNRHVLRRLVGQQGGNFLGQFAKVLGADVVAAHQTQLVSDQGVADFFDVHRKVTLLREGRGNYGTAGPVSTCRKGVWNRSMVPILVLSRRHGYFSPLFPAPAEVSHGGRAAAY